MYYYLNDMLRPISTLKISQESIAKLMINGYNFLEDIQNNKESHKYLTDKELKHLNDVPKTVEIIHLFNKMNKKEIILIPSKNLNIILDRGFQCGTITELCGAMGSGKSQICFQASVAVQLNKRYGGLNGKVVYIDTRDGFSSLRVTDIIQGYRNRYKNLSLNNECILKSIAVFSPQTVTELYDTIENIVKLVKKNPEVRLLIVDSLSHLIQFQTDSWKRTQSYFYILKLLRELSLSNIVIIVTNEMKNQLHNEIKNFQLVSSGGEVTANRMHRRLMLASIKQNQFAAKIIKSSLRRITSMTFQITSDGIED
ncbi:uncharacterized protein LOC127284958 isoform X3 [Leptopilina boulardi]|uniref:uncharacterized protein LOC127284958 isoform X3 n=1 Tax=Leptopilina boulardi TaxID=63433 RepID=UPI0021F59A8F|nr:uncharacterized protein LOC127284958 isoform X3 [Leptopilina boulardi]